MQGLRLSPEALAQRVQLALADVLIKGLGGAEKLR
jgi:hypothetical protein